ncbi:MAG: RNA polymerase sigma factor [Acidobacteriota bacterium]
MSDTALSAIRDDDFERIRTVLVAAVRKLCPAWLSAQVDDLVQDAMIRVIEARKRSETDEALRASYLWRAAHSAVIDEIRRRQRRPETAFDPEAPDPASLGPGPERRAADREAGDALRDCLQTLIDSRRSAVLLYLHGHGVARIAELRQWNHKRAKNLIYRGLADLRDCMAKKGFDRGERR